MSFSSKVLVLSHCLLNKSTRWWQDGKPIERNIGLAAELVEFSLRHNVGVFQMPCPEFTFCGNPRPSRTKDEYEALPGFKEHCDSLARNVVEQLKALVYMSLKPRIQILAIIGVKRSPSCAVSNVIRMVNNEARVVEERGIFMESLMRHILKKGLSVRFLEFDFDEPCKIIADLERLLHQG
ncbi:MAG: 2-thiouracil desulfurase family protein [Candidatus Bathyarchaeia archaeon]